MNRTVDQRSDARDEKARAAADQRRKVRDANASPGADRRREGGGAKVSPGADHRREGGGAKVSPGADHRREGGGAKGTRGADSRRDGGSAPVAGSAIARKLVGEVLRASGRITASRNALLSGFEMTGPRLRVMKTIRRRRVPQTVSQLARAIGIARQTLQATVRDLAQVGFVEFEPNLFHRKAPIVVLTRDGESCLDRVLLVERRWIADLTRGFDERLLAQTEWVLRCLRERLAD
jgi:DNA-binding MarR family transcriptional regulator